MNKILCNFVFAFVLCLNEASCVGQSNSPNLFNLFNEFASQSWKMERITIGGMSKTVEQRIIDEFNAEEWGPGAQEEKIDKDINTDIKNYYKGDLSKLWETANYGPHNPIGWMNDLATDDSPRQWMDKLSLRELYRFKEYVTSSEVFSKVFDNANYKNNDLVKARALCGVFWVVYIDGTALAVQAFSGMLIPGQSFDGEKRIYTCLHGFSNGNKNNNVAYYFVPYGVRADGNIKKRTANNNPNYVVNKGFKVTSLRVNLSGGFEEKEIDDEFFEKSNFGQKNMYNTYDYAVAIIEEKTSNGQTLKELLKSACNPMKEEEACLPLLGQQNKSSAEENMWVALGKGSCGLAVETESNITICSQINDDKLVVDPKRSLDDNQNVKKYPNIGNKGELAVSLPVYYGMSGGPVLKCSFFASGISCNFVGTVWGSERVFTKDSNDQICGFRCFVNLEKGEKNEKNV